MDFYRFARCARGGCVFSWSNLTFRGFLTFRTSAAVKRFDDKLRKLHNERFLYFFPHATRRKLRNIIKEHSIVYFTNTLLAKRGLPPAR